MPQMSPLIWTFLMIFFILFYLVVSVSIYYEVYIKFSKSVGQGANKFLFKLS